MKNLITPLLLSLIFTLSMCTEEILGPERIIWDTVYLDPCHCVRHDTVYLDRVDTVKEIVYQTKDSIVWRVETDSVFVTETIIEYQDSIVYQTDTVHVHHYPSQFIYLGKATDAYDSALAPIVKEFYDELAARGLTPFGELIVYIQPWKAEDMPPANRSSFGIYIGGHWIVLLKESLSIDESYSCIFREFAKHHLYYNNGAPYAYSTDPDAVMNPEFDPKRLKMSDTDVKKKPFLDALFNPQGI